jgi:hypothetical protein
MHCTRNRHDVPQLAKFHSADIKDRLFPNKPGYCVPAMPRMAASHDRKELRDLFHAQMME